MQKRTYTDEFRRQAVALADEVGTSQAARQLGVSDSNVHGWRAKFNGTAKPKYISSKLTVEEQEELKRLRKENAELKKINIILKQCAAFFSQDQLKSGLK